MDVSFHPEAEKELVAAVEHYNRCQDGLGLEFAAEVHRSVDHILAFPKAWARLSKNTRRCLVNRFPYGVIYSSVGGKLLILAVMHLNRKPHYWKHRMPVKQLPRKQR